MSIINEFERSIFGCIQKNYYNQKIMVYIYNMYNKGKGIEQLQGRFILNV